CSCEDGFVNMPACGPNEICCNNTCVSPQSDGSNCGACGVACDAANTVCSNGNCVCNPNYGDCDMDMGNGCEQALGTPEHCQGCNRTCNPGELCSEGFCD